MSKLQLPQVLDALESCGIKTEYFYGKSNVIRDSYYIKDDKYYHSYPDNKSRKIIEDEIETEEKFIYELLCGAKTYISDTKTYISGLSNHPSGLIDILFALCKENNGNDITTCHRALFGKDTPFWTFNIITQKDQLFNKDFNCGIGFIGQLPTT